MEQRLQEIEFAYGKGRAKIEDIYWLIGQAKKVPELEKEVEHLKDELAIMYFKKIEQLQKAQAKGRYNNYLKIVRENLELENRLKVANDKIEQLLTVEKAYEAYKKAR